MGAGGWRDEKKTQEGERKRDGRRGEREGKRVREREGSGERERGREFFF